MPYVIDPSMTLDVIEEDVLYTRAALQADPDAADLLPMTDDWLGWVDSARKVEREAREAEVNADALRGVANARLDGACTAFADELEHALKKDRSAPRYKQFFADPASVFVRKALSAQITTVKGWLKVSKDEVLTRHKDGLERWSNSASAALEATAGTALVRGRSWIAKEQLCEDLTRARDGLHHALTGRGHQRMLPRGYANVFFRSSYRRHRAPRPMTPPAAVEIPTETPASTADTIDHG